MAKKTPKMPAPVDPVTTANAQTASNKETAYWNAIMQNVNQNTPYGSITWTDSSGGKYDPSKPPQFTSTINLTPQAQDILNKQMASEQQLAQLGLEQIGRVKASAATPFSFSGMPAVFGDGDTAAAQTTAEEAIMSRLEPRFMQDEEALRTRLINQGIGQGSEAYNREFERFNQGRNDARMQAILSGQQYGSNLLADSLRRRNQAMQEYTTQRNAPLNEYNAFMSGTQVQNPQFASANYGGAQSGDLQGATQQAYQNAMQRYSAQVAEANQRQQMAGQFLGSVAQFAPTLFAMSDIRVKENINRIASLPSGAGVYSYTYKGDTMPFIGVMAQEMPAEAVISVDGALAVNYGAIQ